MPLLLPSCIHDGNCGFCDIIGLIANIHNIMLAFLGAIMLLIFIVGVGWYLIWGRGNVQKVERGKELLKGTFYGALIVLIAWQLVNLILFVLGGQMNNNFKGEYKVFGNPWSQICQDEQNPCFSIGNGAPCDQDNDSRIDGYCLASQCVEGNACDYLREEYPDYFGTRKVQDKILSAYECQEKKTNLDWECLEDPDLCLTPGEYCCGQVSEQ